MAQVYGKYNTTPYNKLIYDLIYIQNCSIVTDLVLMLKTMRVLLSKSYSEGVGGHKQEKSGKYVLPANSGGIKH